MGQSLAACCCLRASKSDGSQCLLIGGGRDEDRADGGGSSYEPPSEAAVHPAVSLQRKSSSLPFGIQFTLAPSTVQDGYPPLFFKRLNEYIKTNNLRAHDAFTASDLNQDKRLTADEMISGFSRIGFRISKHEERMLCEWMTQIVGHSLSYKEFTLALKQPQRFSILKLQSQRR